MIPLGNPTINLKLWKQLIAAIWYQYFFSHSGASYDDMIIPLLHSLEHVIRGTDFNQDPLLLTHG